MTNWEFKSDDGENFYLEDTTGRQESVWVQVEDGVTKGYQNGQYLDLTESQQRAIAAHAEGGESGERGFGSVVAGGLGGAILGKGAGIGGKKGAAVGAILAGLGSHFLKKKKEDEAVASVTTSTHYESSSASAAAGTGYGYGASSAAAVSETDYTQTTTYGEQGKKSNTEAIVGGILGALAGGAAGAFAGNKYGEKKNNNQY